MTLRVALAEDSFIVREGIAQVLSDHGGTSRSSPGAATSTTLLAAVERARPTSC